MAPLNVRDDFPQLKRRVGGTPLVYLDSAATSLKPASVISAMNAYYRRYSANVFRGIYRISEEATLRYEEARSDIAAFIGAKADEILFTRNATESINLAYRSLMGSIIGQGDGIVTSILEHHSNFVPWQEAAKQGRTLAIWEPDVRGMLTIEGLQKVITTKTKLLAVTQASNVLGSIVDIPAISRFVRSVSPECIILVDGAQSVPHTPIDVSTLGVDLLAFSGHKMLGPTGIGVLWGNRELLSRMEPFLFGGDMISEVHRDHTVYAEIPHKFEAGTPHIAGAIGLGAAVRYLTKLGMTRVSVHEQHLTAYSLERLAAISGVSVIGPTDARLKVGAIAFTVKGIHPHDVAQLLDRDNICVRVGYHCAQPLHEHLGIGPTVRMSLYIYNTKEEIDLLAMGLERVIRTFS